MRRTTYAILSAVSAAVLMLNFHASLTSGTAGAATGGDTSSAGSSTSTEESGSVASTATGQPDEGATSSSTTQAPNGTSSPSSSPSTTTTASNGLNSGTFTGQEAETPYGPVQVQVVISDGTISSADAVVYPDGGGRDQQINSYAIPILNSETVAAQSDQIDMVSGATYTSNGYLTSLQSALDQAGS
ncbi:FMN-binding protein [Actinomyces sp.]|uniref:FMN-binding protein n=1 Tax=Actinomyces sp. TaxID=29317 RepID=UPI00289F1AA9|nr:FMN-binding protein [Actinomyces sp.]